MGMFDSLYVSCKKCDNQIEFQSKVGECNLEKYTIANVPPEIAIDLNGQIQTCEKCDYPNKLIVQVATFIQIT